LAVAAIMLLCSVLSTTAAAAAPIDAASAHRALRAVNLYLTGLLADDPASRQAEDQFVASTTANCPNVLAAVNLLPVTSVGRAAVTAFGEEIGGDLVLMGVIPADRARLAALTRTTTRLRWSRMGTATKIRRSLEAQRKLFSLPPSELCADAHALADVSAQSTPPGTLEFLATYGRASAAGGLVELTDTISRFLTPADDGLISATNRVDDRLKAAERALQVAEVTKLVSAVGLTP
jgi:hypothetical protein